MKRNQLNVGLCIDSTEYRDAEYTVEQLLTGFQNVFNVSDTQSVQDLIRRDRLTRELTDLMTRQRPDISPGMLGKVAELALRPKAEVSAETITEISDDEDPELDWVCRNLSIAPGEIVLINAAGGTGKSLLCDYLAVCVASGLPIFGLPVEQSGSVAMVNTDSAPSMIRTQVNRIARGLGLKSIANPIELYSAQGAFLALPDAKARLTNMMRGRRLFILDSFRAATNEDENDSRVRGPIDQLLRPVSLETGCAVIIVTHSGKGKTGPQASVRGSSAIRDACAEQFDLTRSDDGLLTLRSCKNRNYVSIDSVSYRLSDVGECNSYGRANRLLFAVDQSAELPLRELVLGTVTATPQTATEIAAKVKKRKTDVCTILQDLAAKGEIVLASEGRSKLYCSKAM